MNRCLRAAAVGAAGIVLVLQPFARAQTPQDPPRTTFRSGASVVMVDVNVKDRNGRPLTRLAKEDFEVLDNGVVQQVEDVSYGKVPIDVTVALDVSHSVTGLLLNRLRDGVVRLMRDLGDEDRLKLMLFNMRVIRTSEFTRDVKSVERTIREARAAGGTALLDAVSVALVSASAPDRRQLILFFTDGNDTSSTTTPDALTVVAQRTRATLAFVMPSSTTFRTTMAVKPGSPLPPVTTAVAGPMRMPLYPVFSTLAKETGGSIIPIAPGTDLGAAFRRVLDEFRTTYVLYYTPRNVERGGFHTIEVNVNREGASVQARRGYFSS